MRDPSPSSSSRSPRSRGPGRLRRLHRDRLNTIRQLRIRLPDGAFSRHPGNLAWRVAVMDRWIARDLNLAGGRRLPPWDDPFVDEEDEENWPLRSEARSGTRA
jgi:hypothetical protein